MGVFLDAQLKPRQNCVYLASRNYRSFWGNYGWGSTHLRNPLSHRVRENGPDRAEFMISSDISVITETPIVSENNHLWLRSVSYRCVVNILLNNINVLHHTHLPQKIHYVNSCVATC